MNNSNDCQNNNYKICINSKTKNDLKNIYQILSEEIEIPIEINLLIHGNNPKEIQLQKILKNQFSNIIKETIDSTDQFQVEFKDLKQIFLNEYIKKRYLQKNDIKYSIEKEVLIVSKRDWANNVEFLQLQKDIKNIEKNLIYEKLQNRFTTQKFDELQNSQYIKQIAKTYGLALIGFVPQDVDISQNKSYKQDKQVIIFKICQNNQNQQEDQNQLIEAAAIFDRFTKDTCVLSNLLSSHRHINYLLKYITQGSFFQEFVIQQSENHQLNLINKQISQYANSIQFTVEGDIQQVESLKNLIVEECAKMEIKIIKRDFNQQQAKNLQKNQKLEKQIIYDIKLIKDEVEKLRIMYDNEQPPIMIELNNQFNEKQPEIIVAGYKSELLNTIQSKLQEILTIHKELIKYKLSHLENFYKRSVDITNKIKDFVEVQKQKGGLIYFIGTNEQIEKAYEIVDEYLEKNFPQIITHEFQSLLHKRTFCLQYSKYFFDQFGACIDIFQSENLRYDKKNFITIKVIEQQANQLKEQLMETENKITQNITNESFQCSDQDFDTVFQSPDFVNEVESNFVVELIFDERKLQQLGYKQNVNQEKYINAQFQINNMEKQNHIVKVYIYTGKVIENMLDIIVINLGLDGSFLDEISKQVAQMTQSTSIIFKDLNQLKRNQHYIKKIYSLQSCLNSRRDIPIQKIFYSLIGRKNNNQPYTTGDFTYVNNMEKIVKQEYLNSQKIAFVFPNPNNPVDQDEFIYALGGCCEILQGYNGQKQPQLQEIFIYVENDGQAEFLKNEIIKRESNNLKLIIQSTNLSDQNFQYINYTQEKNLQNPINPQLQISNIYQNNEEQKENNGNLINLFNNNNNLQEGINNIKINNQEQDQIKGIVDQNSLNYSKQLENKQNQNDDPFAYGWYIVQVEMENKLVRLCKTVENHLENVYQQNPKCVFLIAEPMGDSYDTIILNFEANVVEGMQNSNYCAQFQNESIPDFVLRHKSKKYYDNLEKLIADNEIVKLDKRPLFINKNTSDLQFRLSEINFQSKMILNLQLKEQRSIVREKNYVDYGNENDEDIQQTMQQDNKINSQDNSNRKQIFQEQQSNKNTYVIKGLNNYINLAHRYIKAKQQGNYQIMEKLIQDQINEQNLMLQGYSVQNGGIPNYWNNIQNEDAIQITTLSYENSLFDIISNQFFKTMNSSEYTVDKIEIIQNQNLFKKYQQQKQIIAKRHKSFDVEGYSNEQLLFFNIQEKFYTSLYGNSDDAGFLMQTTAIQSSYGNAIYFYQAASQVHKYNKLQQKDGKFVIIIANVAIGQQIKLDKPNQQLEKPPEMIKGISYDTVQGFEDNTEVFAIYEDNRAYCSFLIHYSEIQ